jgi:signal transduction histidine kinase
VSLSSIGKRCDRAIKAEANNGSFYVSVRDTGPGISTVDQTKLFQEFQRPTMRSPARKVAPAWGWRYRSALSRCTAAKIWVESQPGQGSTFAFTLPVIVERQVEAA